jgi:hypothetical protein
VTKSIVALLFVTTTLALAAGFTFKAPAGWKSVPSSSSMRVAQFALPRAPGDTVDGELVVYYFGGSGGTIDANIARWIGQMQQPDGKPSDRVAKQSKRALNGLPATLVDVSGTYIAEMTPGSKARYNNPNFRLRAVVIETPNGPYFIKLVGPSRTVAAHERAFEEFLSSVQYSK